jgi:hypothetical protein
VRLPKRTIFLRFTRYPLTKLRVAFELWGAKSFQIMYAGHRWTILRASKKDPTVPPGPGEPDYQERIP